MAVRVTVISVPSVSVLFVETRMLKRAERRSSCILVAYRNFPKRPTEAAGGPLGQLRGSALRA